MRHRFFQVQQSLPKDAMEMSIPWQDRILKYRMPYIHQKFSSSLHRIENLILEDSEIVEAVCERRKPIGVVVSETEKERNQFLKQAQESGCWTAIEPVQDIEQITIGIPGRIGEVLNIALLKEDYHWWCHWLPLSQRGVIESKLMEQLTQMEQRYFYEYARFKDIEGEWGNRKCKYETWIRCGLLLGYPPATTASLLLSFTGQNQYGSNLESLKDGWDRFV